MGPSPLIAVPWYLRLPEQVVELAVDVDEVAFRASRDDAVSAPEELRRGAERSLEVGLAERRGERDVQDVRTVVALRPDLHVALASLDFKARGQQLSCEDPLNRLVGSDVECHLDRIGIVGAVVETGHQGNGSMLGDYQAEAQLSGDRNAVHHGVLTFALSHHGEPSCVIGAVAIAFDGHWFRGTVALGVDSAIPTARNLGHWSPKRL